ncbi:hypothetical protein IVA96_25250 [Bradyrhizobium sp. 159]|uniref:hypothetical protein n=1 Tax=unclassified Bradyrhizobium TaxID=2631580 RepID=UPI001FF7F0F4|nr:MULTISPECIES: hypothetical protein [unclassified Bradyrhizobium]MCK1619822.1 hypothetical protein [Bradyrhizobium sp. 159]MCK1664728.1 hypothetical protein [Bradyrhizobium sp. 153]
MGNRTAKFISALVGSIIAGAPLAAVSQNAQNAPSTANAAADCLVSPKGAAPQGQHWYYRIERGTKRQCWYLRAADDKDGAKSVQSAQATSDTPTGVAPAQQQQQQQQHPAQDARAEYLTARSGVAAKAPNATAQAAGATPAQPSADQTADGNAQQSATPWPDVSATSAPPAPQPAPAVVATAAQPSAKPSKSPSSPAPAAADSTTDKPTGSVQMLLLVIGGALALAGILASLIYRFAGARVRVQSADRRIHWDDWEPQKQDASRAPWLDATSANAQPSRPIDFDAPRPQATKQATKLAAIGREIDLIDARKSRAAIPAAEPDEVRPAEAKIKMFDRDFEIEAAAPRLAANEIGKDRDEAPAGRDEDAVDVDVITTMLEQLVKEGPRLSRPNLEADLANFARSLQGQSAARA